MTNALRTALDPAHFSVSARVAMQLGRESISSSITAVLELLKNSYDADAENVVITIERSGGAALSLVIEDDGSGMSLEELLNRWMVIGTSDKQSQPESHKKGRAQTGEKGLGRLGLDRLSSLTTISTRKKDAGKITELEIDWKKYEGVAAKLESISHPVFEIDVASIATHSLLNSQYGQGTRLVMRGLKDRWSDDEIISLRRELSLLLSPLVVAQDFNIFVRVSDSETLSGRIDPPTDLLNAAMWKVSSKVSPEGDVAFEMTSNQHSGFYSLGPMKWPDVIKSQGEVPLFGAIEVLFFFFPREATKAGSAAISRARIVAFLNENQGVRIYRDGFRVKPYGQPNGEGDWLTLANRRVQNPQGVKQKGLWRVGPNQIVGGVFISRSRNPLLNDQTNREGLLEGDAFAQLRAFLLVLISWFERSHQTHERKFGPVETRTSVEAAARASETASAAASETIKKLREEIAAAASAPKHDRVGFAKTFNKLLTEVQQKIDSSVKEAERTVKTAQFVQAEADRQKDALANLASLGILAASFGHETVNWSGNVLKNAIQLGQDFDGHMLVAAPADATSVKRRLSDLRADAERIRKFAKFSLGNVLRDKRTKSTFSPSHVAKYVFESFREILEQDRNIDINLDLKIAAQDGIKGYEADWECIFVNLITNSVWALRDTLAIDRKIEVSISRVGEEIVVEFLDSGFGLEAGTEEAIFEPTFTTKRNERGEATGTGLGLSIVRSFVVENSDGEISAMAKGRLGGAAFSMRIPRVELKGK